MKNPGPIGTSKPLVLIVDDQPENVHALASILAGDARTIFALDGEQALARIQDRTVDLVLLDVMLPGMNGFAVCEALKADPVTADIPVIFVSGLNEGQDEQRGFAVGAVDYVHKPFQPAIVKARVTTHLKLQSALRQLAALARVDGLTGLWNRRYFEERLEIEVERARRFQLPLSLILADLDHFKRVNDVHGHAAGDQVLGRTATLLQAQIGRGDLVARWGGEEFAVLVGGGLGECIELAERMRCAVAGALIEPVGTQTMSFGIAQFLPNQAVTEWFERADRALYRAKDSGRNRSIADPALP